MSERNLSYLELTEHDFHKYYAYKRFELDLEINIEDFFSEYYLTAFTDLPYSKIALLSAYNKQLVNELFKTQNLNKPSA